MIKSFLTLLFQSNLKVKEVSELFKGDENPLVLRVDEPYPSLSTGDKHLANATHSFGIHLPLSL